MGTERKTTLVEPLLHCCSKGCQGNHFVTEGAHNCRICCRVPLDLSLLSGRCPLTVLRTILEVSHCFFKVGYVFVVPDQMCLMSGKLLLMRFIQCPDEANDLVVDSLTDLGVEVGTESAEEVVDAAIGSSIRSQ